MATSTTWAKEKCTEILAMADAEWRDARDRGSLTDLCPILTALKNIDPRKSVSGIQHIYMFFD